MSFRERVRRGKVLVAMIHVGACPGTPLSRRAPAALAAEALAQARVYAEAGVDTVMIENMHDVPYMREVGPEVTATMAVVGKAVKETGLHCGIQILAGANREALACAHAAGLDFVRAEGWVFAHVGDEGLIQSTAGEVCRYRRAIGADEVMIFTDVKKKHSSHAITDDVDLLETAHAATFFLSDGLIVTGSSTGVEADPADLEALASVEAPVWIGSGITRENLGRYWALADGFVVGSHLKRDGRWEEAPDPARVAAFMARFRELEESGNRGPRPRRAARSSPGDGEPGDRAVLSGEAAAEIRRRS